MNLDHQRQSANFEDRTGWSEGQRRLHTIATLLNPMLAAANFQGWLQRRGIAPSQEIDLSPRRNVLGILSKF